MPFRVSTASATTESEPGSTQLYRCSRNMPQSPINPTATSSVDEKYRDMIRSEAKQQMKDIDEDISSCQERLTLLAKMKDLKEKRRRLMEFI